MEIRKLIYDRNTRSEDDEEKRRCPHCGGELDEDEDDEERHQHQSLVERRFGTFVEIRADQKPMRVSGYAATYNMRSNPIALQGGGSFRERIRAGAFDKPVAMGQDVVALFNHNRDAVLGRTSAGTLTLRSDSKGLAFECDLPDTTLGRDTYESVRRGDIKDCSFGFKGVEDDWDEEEDEDRSMCAVRTIRSFKTLDDISLVTRPAYPGTQVSARQELVACETRSAFDAFLRTKVENESDLERGQRIVEQWHKDSTVVVQRRRNILNLL